MQDARQTRQSDARARRGVAPVQSVERVFQIIDALARKSAGVSELARVTGMHKATVHRFLVTLRRLGYVEELPDGSGYQLGLRLIELGGRVLSRLDFREVARPYLAELRDTTRLTVHMAVLDGTEVVYVEKLDSPANIRMASYVGTRNPVYCTALGKAILSALPPADVQQILQKIRLVPRTARTLKTTEELLEDLDRSRRRGFSVDDVENEDGIRCVGAPVYRHTGEVLGAISVSGPVFHVPPDRVEELGRQVNETARLISRALGCSAPLFGGGSSDANH
ncbi:MAG: IclR family transcriptional regulator [Bacillota bacterium]